MLASLWLALSFCALSADAIYLLHRSAAMHRVAGPPVGASNSNEPEPSPIGDGYARDTWEQCIDEHNADMVMVATLTIPGVASGIKYEVPIKRSRLKDEKGQLIYPGRVCSMLNCDGARGCLGISINVDPDLYMGADAGLRLSIYIYWIPHVRHGSPIDRQLVIPVGPATRVSIGESSTLDVEFRPSHSASPSTAPGQITPD